MAGLRLAVVFLAIVVAAAPSAAQTKAVPKTEAEVRASFAPLVRQTAPAVVNIYTSKRVRVQQSLRLFDDPFFRRFFGEDFGREVDRPRERVQNSLGSGVIVGADGLVMTNHHVIEGADEIRVVLADRREFDAEVVGSDERTDLAVLRVKAVKGTLPFLEFDDSDQIEVGDLVLAIGNPFGVGQTVTSGIVSAVARTHVGISDLNFFIQTDAAINPGNSGGALVGMDGRLIGINTAIFSKSGGSHGIGFAIPSNMVRSVLAGLTSTGRIVRPWFGAWCQPVTGEMAGSLGLDRPNGVLVNEIYPSSPAERAGIRVGDVILAVDGHEVSDPGSLRYRVATLPVGGTASFKVLRKAGGEHEIKVGLIAPAEDPPRDITEVAGRNPLSGATCANMSPALADELGVDRPVPGVFVVGIQRGGIAHRLGFQPGDQILAVNDAKIERMADLRKAVGRTSERWRISLRREGKVLNWVIEG